MRCCRVEILLNAAERCEIHIGRERAHRTGESQHAEQQWGEARGMLCHVRIVYLLHAQHCTGVFVEVDHPCGDVCLAKQPALFSRQPAVCALDLVEELLVCVETPCSVAQELRIDREIECAKIVWFVQLLTAFHR